MWVWIAHVNSYFLNLILNRWKEVCKLVLKEAVVENKRLEQENKAWQPAEDFVSTVKVFLGSRLLEEINPQNHQRSEEALPQSGMAESVYVVPQIPQPQGNRPTGPDKETEHGHNLQGPHEPPLQLSTWTGQRVRTQ